MPKNVTSNLLQNIKNLEGPFGDEKLNKSGTVPKKNQRRDPLYVFEVLDVGFVYNSKRFFNNMSNDFCI